MPPSCHRGAAVASHLKVGGERDFNIEQRWGLSFWLASLQLEERMGLTLDPDILTKILRSCPILGEPVRAMGWLFEEAKASSLAHVLWGSIQPTLNSYP